MAALLLLVSASTEPLSARDWVRLDYDYRRDASSLTCVGYTNAGAHQRFEEVFGTRMKRARRWFEQRFTPIELDRARQQEFGDDFVMVGGCKLPSSRRRVTDSFHAKLHAVENRMRVGAIG